MLKGPEVMLTLIPHMAGGIIKRKEAYVGHPAEDRDQVGLIPAEIFAAYLGLLRFQNRPILEGQIVYRNFKLAIRLDSFVDENDCGIKLELVQSPELGTSFLFYPDVLKRMDDGQLSQLKRGDVADLKGLAKFLRRRYQ